jgi:hypothetical protein
MCVTGTTTAASLAQRLAHNKLLVIATVVIRIVNLFRLVVAAMWRQVVLDVP